MEHLPINILDLGIALLFLLGALIGLALGFVKAGLFVLSWIGAILVTIFGFAAVQPYTRHWIETTWIADVTAGAGLFFLSIIVLFLISSMIGGWVRASRLNVLDRSLGMLAGLATTALIVAVGGLITESMVPQNEYPRWAREAKSMPVIRQGAHLLNVFVSRNLPGLGSRTEQAAPKRTGESRLNREEALERIIQPAPRESEQRERAGYDKSERRDLDRLIQSSQ
jgi:membrane protein required for colicin V production